MEERSSILIAFAYSLAAVGLTFSMALGEAIFIHFHKTVAIYQPWGGPFLYYGPTFICGLFCIPSSILIWRLPKQKWLVLFSAVALSLFIGFRFRGSFIWPGTFDVDILGTTTMIYPLLSASVIGLVYTLAIRTEAPNIKVLCYVVGSIGVLGIISSTIHSFSNHWIESEFAFTRNQALYASALAVPIAAYIINRYQDEL